MTAIASLTSSSSNNESKNNENSTQSRSNSIMLQASEGTKSLKEKGLKKLIRIRTALVRGKRKERENYWKINFFIVFLPFTILGIPIHALLFRDDKNMGVRTRAPKTKINSDFNPNPPSKFQIPRKTSDNNKLPLPAHLTHTVPQVCFANVKLWFKLLFGSWPFACISFILLPFVLIPNFKALIIVLGIVKDLLIDGVISNNLIPDIYHLYSMMPFWILMNYVWILGYLLKVRIKSFDERDSLIKEFEGEFDRRIELDSEYKFRSKPRVKLALMYVIIFLMHGLHWLIMTRRIHQENWTSDRKTDYVSRYWPMILNSLSFPVYACFCWAILSQIENMSAVMSHLIEEGRPLTRSHLKLFKGLYQHISESVHHVNSMFQTVSSIIMSNLLLPLLIENMAMFTYFGEYFFRHILPQIQGSWDVINSSENSTFLGNSTFGPSSPNYEGVPMTTIEWTPLPPDLVRTFVAEMIVLALYGLLAYLLISPAISVNHEIKYFHVWLNDAASESHIVYQPELNQDVNDQHFVEAFKLLKCYIFSLEERKPTLLVITVLPFIRRSGRRVVTYNV